MTYIGPQQLSLRNTGPQLERRNRSITLPDDVLPIIAVDPGGITGWSLLVLPKDYMMKSIWEWPQDVILKNKVSWTHGEIDCKKDELKGTYVLKRLIDEWPSAVVVMEGFQIRQMAVELSPVRIIARVEESLWLANRPMITQMPAMKATANNDRLKDWGVYTELGGLEHARDADRHALMFMRRCMERKGIQLREFAWPHIYNATNDDFSLIAQVGPGHIVEIDDDLDGAFG